MQYENIQPSLSQVLLTHFDLNLLGLYTVTDSRKKGISFSSSVRTDVAVVWNKKRAFKAVLIYPKKSNFALTFEELFCEFDSPRNNHPFSSPLHLFSLARCKSLFYFLFERDFWVLRITPIFMVIARLFKHSIWMQCNLFCYYLSGISYDFFTF